MSYYTISVGEFDIHPEHYRLYRGETQIDIEPKVLDLLVLFCSRPGEVLSKAEIAQAIWKGVEVNDDALSRTIWKLRQALNDDAKTPRYIETVPKRGYQLIAEVSEADSVHKPLPMDQPNRLPVELMGLGVILVLAIGLLFVMPSLTGQTNPETDTGREVMLQRADAFYAQYTRSDNEAALSLYETMLASHPDDAAALAGVSNAIVQRVLRFTGPGGTQADRRTLIEALESGWLDSSEAQPGLIRAEALARRATEADPGHARAWRAHGLALATLRRFDEAEVAYNRALVIQPDEWGSLINLSDIAQIAGDTDRSTAYLERAYEAMSLRFEYDAVLVLPWQSELGLTLAQRKLQAGQSVEAESWFRRVLAADPLNPEAVSGLAEVLRDGGDVTGADALCEDLRRRTGQECAT